MKMGKWSDDKSVDVANSQGVPMSNVAWDTSGDVGWEPQNAAKYSTMRLPFPNCCRFAEEVLRLGI